jgi:CsoR family transcriptional regulator, copper-sensing transcriptional repressor
MRAAAPAEGARGRAGPARGPAVRFEELPVASILNLPEGQRTEMIDRLKKIEGQAKGIQRMIEEGRDCIDVMNQVAAVKAAANALSGEMLEAFALRCLQHPEEFPSPREAVEQAVRALVRAGR